jgi:hypothetical protein
MSVADSLLVLFLDGEAAQRNEILPPDLLPIRL